MTISKYNQERYSDPTPYMALAKTIQEGKAVHKAAFKPLVYICSPYAGDITNNVLNARKYCRFAYEHNAIPIAMHLLLPQFMRDEDPKEREQDMHFNYVMLGKCDEIWVFGNSISEGMAHEIGLAKKRQQKIRWFDEEMKAVNQ